jgi:hypothetical protein
MSVLLFSPSESLFSLLELYSSHVESVVVVYNIFVALRGHPFEAGQVAPAVISMSL